MIKIPTIETLDKCPHCHKEYLVESDTDKTYGLAIRGKNGKLDDKVFIPLKIKKCPECGAIFLFEKN